MIAVVVPSPVALAEGEWRARAAAHRERIDVWVAPHLARRRRGQAHPVLDFLFTYYTEPPGRLRRWHPGAGVALAGPGARERLAWPHHGEVAAVDADGRTVPAVGIDVPAFLARRRETVVRIADLLGATAGRPAHFGCFGLHEWAMVYRPERGEVRHDLPLRLGQAGTDAVVDAHRVRCSHHDAYRFFSRRATPLNALRPTRQSQRDLEQPGCLHAGMDLFKWAGKLAPAVPGELLADCLDLAGEIRVLDMRASPYDLADLGHPPVRIETPQGKAEYVAAQRRFSERAAALRARLLAVCTLLLDADVAWSPSRRRTVGR
ncbi:3-methyladenine DNA glycosylase [Geodermatophilus sp. YIM 151500]|uniref:3-methyladenine DNA glycosylase n=1 Tax=Geodermatophilus sp. YIM 151500 TaxID=2984531 RepID=UPI0021E48470|nr:3-methyladenine DNA glycosylase [Geodermatophilus sp. YIM 151500]MCV2490189.1 3-methyladenine DNA glycosylase [Geodermatophilus sp. YIM 151500]